MSDSYQEMVKKHGGFDKYDPSKVPQVKIKSLHDLHQLISLLKPSNDGSHERTVYLDNVETSHGVVKKMSVNISDDGQSMVRKLFTDGFNMLKRHREFESKSVFYSDEIDGFGGFNPAIPPADETGISWVDMFVTKHLDGKIDGLHVVWDLPEGRYKLDPWTCNLERIND